MATGDIKSFSVTLDTLERAYVTGALAKQIQSVERAVKAATSDRMSGVLREDMNALYSLKAKFSHG